LTMTVASLRVLLPCHKDQRTLSLYFSAWENAFLCSLSELFTFALLFALCVTTLCLNVTSFIICCRS
jgi:hypothetical protein